MNIINLVPGSQLKPVLAGTNMANIPVRALSSPKNDHGLTDGFSIRDVAVVLGGQDMRQELHRHDFFFILALEEGAGQHQIDFLPYQISDHSVFMLRPGQVHQLELAAGSSGYLLAFSNEFYRPENPGARQRLRKAGSKPLCTIGEEGFDRLKQVLDAIYKEYQTAAYGHRDAIRAGLDLLFIELVRRSQRPGERIDGARLYEQERYEEFRELLEEHVSQQKQPSDYAGLMNLSLFQLNGITRAATGKTAASLISDHIILEAKRLLLGTPLQIKEVACQLGYEDISYFSRFFKRHTGRTPESFRNNSG